MAYLIGTDEAGYGPNLGPLTICGTFWQVPQTEIDLYHTLKNIVIAGGSEPGKFAICDSKAIYNSAGSLKHLETAVLAVLYSLLDQFPEDACSLPSLLSNTSTPDPEDDFNFCASQLKLPLIASPTEIKSLSTRFQEECEAADIRMLKIQCAAVFPRQFNELVRHHGNKAELLSATTLRLIEELKRNFSGKFEIVCDKHGGRSKYLGLIQQYLTADLVSVVRESSPVSIYRWQEQDSDFQIRFQVGGESFLPTALSSMIAKYVREVYMMVWNQFWALKIPGIRPTKGYPVDAKRFKKEIAQIQGELGIGDDSVWRCR